MNYSYQIATIYDGRGHKIGDKRNCSLEVIFKRDTLKVVDKNTMSITISCNGEYELNLHGQLKNLILKYIGVMKQEHLFELCFVRTEIYGEVSYHIRNLLPLDKFTSNGSNSSNTKILKTSSVPIPF